MLNRNILLSILSLFNLIQAHDAPEDGYYKREHSLVKPYSHGGGAMPFYDSTGDTMVTSNFVRLTPDDKSRKGGLWNKVPIYSRAWEVVVTFKLHGNSRNLAADGLAIWYISAKKQEGGVFGGPNQWKGLGVFLDTYKNGQSSGAFPRVSGFINDGTWEFDHATDGEEQKFGHCYAMARNRDHDTDLKIRYKERVLSVEVDVDNNGSWRKCFERHNVFLPTGYFLGFTAATGDLSDNHDIIAVRTYQVNTKESPSDMSWNLETPRIEDPEGTDSAAAGSSAPDEPSGSSKLLVFFLIALAVCGWVGYTMFQKKQLEQRKRFY